MKSIVLVGGGGHCHSCIDVIEKQNEYKIEGILDSNPAGNDTVLGYPVLGNDSLIPELVKSGMLFLITIGLVGVSKVRAQIFSRITQLGGVFATVVSPFSAVSRFSEIGEGSVVFHGAIVNAGTIVGQNCIINSRALIEHDCQVGNHCHISTGSILNGSVKVGTNSMVGSGTVILQNIELGDDVFIGAASLVTKSILFPGVFFGSPAKEHKNE